MDDGENFCIFCKGPNGEPFRLEPSYVLPTKVCPNVECCFDPAIWKLAKSLNDTHIIRKKEQEMGIQRYESDEDDSVPLPSPEKIAAAASPAVTHVMSPSFEIPTGKLYLMWPNRESLCWLNASLSLLFNSESLKEVLDAEDVQETVLAIAYKEYMRVLSELEKDESLETLADLQQRLQDCQYNIVNILEKAMGIKRGNPDSPIFAIPVLLKESDKFLQFFELKHRWVLKCEVCQAKHTSPPAKKSIISFQNVPSDFSMNDPSTYAGCKKCRAANQIRQLLTEKLPKNIITLFQYGLPHSNMEKYDFVCGTRQYKVKGFVQYTEVNGIKHFVTAIRDVKNDSWLDCNDLGAKIRRYVSDMPRIPPSEVHLVLWEEVSDQLPLPPQPNGVMESAPQLDELPLVTATSSVMISSQVKGMQMEMTAKSQKRKLPFDSDGPELKQACHENDDYMSFMDSLTSPITASPSPVKISPDSSPIKMVQNSLPSTLAQNLPPPTTVQNQLPIKVVQNNSPTPLSSNSTKISELPIQTASEIKAPASSSPSVKYIKVFSNSGASGIDKNLFPPSNTVSTNGAPYKIITVNPITNTVQSSSGFPTEKKLKEALSANQNSPIVAPALRDTCVDTKLVLSPPVQDPEKISCANVNFGTESPASEKPTNNSQTFLPGNVGTSNSVQPMKSLMHTVTSGPVMLKQDLVAGAVPTGANVYSVPTSHSQVQGSPKVQLVQGSKQVISVNPNAMAEMSKMFSATASGSNQHSPKQAIPLTMQQPNSTIKTPEKHLRPKLEKYIQPKPEKNLKPDQGVRCILRKLSPILTARTSLDGKSAPMFLSACTKRPLVSQAFVLQRYSNGKTASSPRLLTPIAVRRPCYAQAGQHTSTNKASNGSLVDINKDREEEEFIDEPDSVEGDLERNDVPSEQIAVPVPQGKKNDVSSGLGKDLAEEFYPGMRRSGRNQPHSSLGRKKSPAKTDASVENDSLHTKGTHANLQNSQHAYVQNSPEKKSPRDRQASLDGSQSTTKIDVSIPDAEKLNGTKVFKALPPAKSIPLKGAPSKTAMPTSSLYDMPAGPSDVKNTSSKGIRGRNPRGRRGRKRKGVLFSETDSESSPDRELSYPRLESDEDNFKTGVDDMEVSGPPSGVTVGDKSQEAPSTLMIDITDIITSYVGTDILQKIASNPGWMLSIGCKNDNYAIESIHQPPSTPGGRPRNMVSIKPLSASASVKDLNINDVLNCSAEKQEIPGNVNLSICINNAESLQNEQHSSSPLKQQSPPNSSSRMNEKKEESATPQTSVQPTCSSNASPQSPKKSAFKSYSKMGVGTILPEFYQSKLKESKVQLERLNLPEIYFKKFSSDKKGNSIDDASKTETAVEKVPQPASLSDASKPETAMQKVPKLASLSNASKTEAAVQKPPSLSEVPMCLGAEEEICTGSEKKKEEDSVFVPKQTVQTPSGPSARRKLPIDVKCIQPSFEGIKTTGDKQTPAKSKAKRGRPAKIAAASSGRKRQSNARAAKETKSAELVTTPTRKTRNSKASSPKSPAVKSAATRSEVADPKKANGEASDDNEARQKTDYFLTEEDDDDLMDLFK